MDAQWNSRCDCDDGIAIEIHAKPTGPVLNTSRRLHRFFHYFCLSVHPVHHPSFGWQRCKDANHTIRPALLCEACKLLAADVVCSKRESKSNANKVLA